MASDLSPSFSKELADLRAASEHEFDALCRTDMIAIHEKHDATFAGKASHGTSPDPRAVATETHRIVARHLGERGASAPPPTDPPARRATASRQGRGP